MQTFPRIHVLEKFKKRLRQQGSLNDYQQLMQANELTSEALAQVCWWDPDQKTTILLDETQGMQLELMCWEPRQEDYNAPMADEARWIRLLTGKLEIAVMPRCSINDTSAVERRQLLLPGQTLFNDQAQLVHRLKNTFVGRTISLQLSIKKYHLHP